jgi:hypothetical protein
MSTILSTNNGSEDSLNPSCRWGFRSNFRQIRPIVDGARPDRRAIDARDQWVASFGVSSSVAVRTSSTGRLEPLPPTWRSRKPHTLRRTEGGSAWLRWMLIMAEV